MKALDLYKGKRNFRRSPEPVGRGREASKPIFVVQRHAARRLHFDFRLQVNGVLASWAVPKGPPQENGEKRLAIHVEDHPVQYANFEGDIPEGNYGAGHVDIWDKGTFETEGIESAAAQIAKGEIKFSLSGERLNGRFVLVKMRHSARENECLFIRKSPPESTDAEPPKTGSKRDGKHLTVGGAAARPEKLDAAEKSPMPKAMAVALAQLSDKPFSSPEWIFEIKWDGERSLAFIQDGEVELRSRSGRNITSEYPELKNVVKQFGARKAILDGEIVALDDQGRSDFSRIQPRFGVSNPPLSLQHKNPVT